MDWWAMMSSGKKNEAEEGNRRKWLFYIRRSILSRLVPGLEWWVPSCFICLRAVPPKHAAPSKTHSSFLLPGEYSSSFNPPHCSGPSTQDLSPLWRMDSRVSQRGLNGPINDMVIPSSRSNHHPFSNVFHPWSQRLLIPQCAMLIKLCLMSESV